ncbi:diadenylate cyclase CdaA [bacterium]|nr:diadenylate cyclase CdaA [bacterium]
MVNKIFHFLEVQINSFNLNFNFSWIDVTQILIILIALLTIYKKFIKNTASEKLVKGIFFLALSWAFSEILIRINLNILGMFIKTLVMFIALGLIVIFQPELRRILSYLGQGGFFNELISTHTNKNRTDIDIMKELIEAVKYLSKNKIGALMVFQNEMETSSYFDVGTNINADISTELILTIFHPNTPLHDGAMVIKNLKILSAGVLLPLTEDPKLSWRYGTRHRAAIGVTEVSDCACLVVSEETGSVSVSMDGKLKKYEDLATLKTDLENIIGLKKETEPQNQKIIFKIDSLITIKKNDLDKQ